MQEVFYELVEANRLLMPIDHVTGWLFRVARNRITDLFRKQKPEAFSDTAPRDFGDEDGEVLRIEDLLPSPDAGPEALYVRHVLLDELELALDELPNDQPYGQREVFIAHELEGRSFKELSAESGVNVNTLLSRKRLITFWQALGLLALCRILFGGFGLSGGGNRHSRWRMEGRIRERVRERMDERWEQMTPEEREKLRQGMRSGCGGRTTPLDSNPRRERS